MNRLARDSLRDLIGLITMIWAFSLAIWFVYVWYQSYAMIDSFEREREWPKDWFDRVLAYVAFHLSTENWSKLCFSSNVSSKTKRHRRRFYLGCLYFLAIMISGLGVDYLWQLASELR